MSNLVEINKEEIKNLVGEKKVADLVMQDTKGEKFLYEVKNFATLPNDSLIDLEIALRQCKRVGVFKTRE